MISPRQRLVLDAGMPFLFIDQLVAQAPATQVPGEMSGRKTANPDFSLRAMAGTEMKPGRSFLLLTGIALLGAFAGFNEITQDSQASLLFTAAKTARTTSGVAAARRGRDLQRDDRAGVGRASAVRCRSASATCGGRGQGRGRCSAPADRDAHGTSWGTGVSVRKSAVGAAAQAIVDDAGPADLFAVAPAATAEADSCYPRLGPADGQVGGAGASHGLVGAAPSSARKLTNRSAFSSIPQRKTSSACASARITRAGCCGWSKRARQHW